MESVRSRQSRPVAKAHRTPASSNPVRAKQFAGLDREIAALQKRLPGESREAKDAGIWASQYGTGQAPGLSREQAEVREGLAQGAFFVADGDQKALVETLTLRKLVADGGGSHLTVKNLEADKAKFFTTTDARSPFKGQVAVSQGKLYSIHRGRAYQPIVSLAKSEWDREVLALKVVDGPGWLLPRPVPSEAHLIRNCTPIKLTGGQPKTLFIDRQTNALFLFDAAYTPHLLTLRQSE